MSEIVKSGQKTTGTTIIVVRTEAEHLDLDQSGMTGTRIIGPGLEWCSWNRNHRTGTRGVQLVI